MRWGASIAFGLGVFLGLPAVAGTVATVQATEGTLSLNRGDGYVEVLSWADAPSGSQVMANPGSRGKVIYAEAAKSTSALARSTRTRRLSLPRRTG